MPGDDSRNQRPRDFVIDGAWPAATLADHQGALVAQELSRRLGERIAQLRLSANRLAVLSGINRQTIANVLAGAVWPDLLTIARLEQTLEWDLWPGRHPVASRADVHRHLAVPDAGHAKFE